jgi:hypothetical protein
VQYRIFVSRGSQQTPTSKQHCLIKANQKPKTNSTMSEEEDIAALVIDNGSGMCKGMYFLWNCSGLQ